MNRDDLTFFEDRAAMRAWMTKSHDKFDELHIGFYKTSSKRPSISYPEAVDEALCFGWIDGVRHAVDKESYTTRFTPRRKGSIWSAINIKRIGELTAAGLMAPSGISAFESRDPSKANKYSFEQAEITFDDGQRAQLEANEEASRFFEAQPPGYKRIATWWVVSAKQEATRQRRMSTLVSDSAAGRRIAAALSPGRQPKSEK